MSINILFTGGLGNQMFQYAFGRGLESRGRNVTFNKTSMDLGVNVHERPDKDSPAPHLTQEEAMKYVCAYGLDLFRTKITFGPPEGELVDENGMQFHPEFYEAVGPVTLRGVWFCERYFGDIAEQIREELTPIAAMPLEIEALSERIRSVNSVAFHIRRGDYALPEVLDFHGLLPLSYYSRAFKYISERQRNLRVFIFSDDSVWCQKNVPGEVVTTGDRYQDLWLMRQCRHVVIANSSYSWWAAWLGDNQEDRIVAAPERWFAREDKQKASRDINPKRWVVL